MDGLDAGLGRTSAWPRSRAAALSLLFCLALVATRRWHGRFTNDGTGGVQKFHDVPTPRIGGLALALAYALVWPVLPEALRPVWALIGLAGAAAAARRARRGPDRPGRRALPAARDHGRRASSSRSSPATRCTRSTCRGSTGCCPSTSARSSSPASRWAASPTRSTSSTASTASPPGSLLIMLAAFAWVAHRLGDDLVFALAVLYARAGPRLLPGQLPARQDLPRRRRRLFRRLPAGRARGAAADAQPRDLGLDRDPDLRLSGDRDAGLDAPQGAARRPQRRPAGPRALPHAGAPPLRPAASSARRDRCTCATRRPASSPGRCRS